MVTFTVPLEVADPQGRRYETVAAIVDSGATYTVLPGSILEQLGVPPRHEKIRARWRWPSRAWLRQNLDAARRPTGTLARGVPG